MPNAEVQPEFDDNFNRNLKRSKRVLLGTIALSSVLPAYEFVFQGETSGPGLVSLCIAASATILYGMSDIFTSIVTTE